MENVTIVGSGPAGLTAAIYAARANLNPLILTGDEQGGQVSITSNIENYPGFPEGIGGLEMYELFRKQAERFGARIVLDAVESVDFKHQPLVLRAREAEYETKTVIIATGSTPRKLGVPGEKEFVGRGVSYCATCDGFFFQDKPVAVVGGGDSAIDEALFLTRFASQLSIIHRRDRLRASKILQDRAFKNEKIDFVWDSVVEKVVGDEQVTRLHLKNVKSGEIREFPVDGVFIFIGHLPNTQVFDGQIDLNEAGYAVTDGRTRTNVPGVFACGDVQDSIYRQAVTAAGTGAMAAIEAEKYLAELEGRPYPPK